MKIKPILLFERKNNHAGDRQLPFRVSNITNLGFLFEKLLFPFGTIILITSYLSR